MRVRDEKGFTLIEILIVITILGILAAIIAPNFVGFDYEGRAGSTISNLGSLRAAIAIFRVKQGSYPATLADLTTTDSDPGTAGTQPFINRVPKELISSSSGSNSETATVPGNPSTVAGWYYNSAGGDVRVAWRTALASQWGQYSGQVPYDEW